MPLWNAQNYTTAGGRLCIETTCLVGSYTSARRIASLHLYWMLWGNNKCGILRMSSWSCQLNSVSRNICWQEIEEADFISGVLFAVLLFLVWGGLFVWVFFVLVFVCLFVVIQLVFGDLSFATLCWCVPYTFPCKIRVKLLLLKGLRSFPLLA